jgi:hypothetical protein
MQLFLHTLTGIRIINEPLEWRGTLAEFLQLETGYPGLPPGAVTRYQTPDVQYVEDGAGRHADPVDCLPYCSRVAAYLSAGVIYAHVELSANRLNVDDQTACLDWAAHLKASADPAAPDLPISMGWIIKLRHENGIDLDMLDIYFHAGACEYSYRYRAGMPLGDWHVRDADFGPVPVGNQTYRVQLAQPVVFTLYRQP